MKGGKMGDRDEIILEEIDTAKLVQEIKERVQEASNEEELRVGFAIIWGWSWPHLKLGQSPKNIRLTCGI
ncbi:MAG: hypothetical protein DRN49_00160 [Thaumarchaeota archaeon]|nr:MAG: hypothetical protein DRN49_00160 [Nitrososphaerota archaeon]